MNKKKELRLRTGLMLLGILLIGICVSLFRLSGFGTDPFTAMNLGISMFIGWSFGTWQLTINICLFIIILFTMRRCIGAGALINMVFVGYIADLICWTVQDVLKIQLGLPARIGALVLALLFASLGVALYMKANMGLSPYDSVALMIEKFTGGRIPFQAARILSDVTVLLIGILFCSASGHSIWLVAGVGTIFNAMLNGPVIQFFTKKLNQICILPETANS